MVMESATLDVFELRNKLIDDYAEYATSFVTINDERVRELVEEELSQGLLWPEPLVQLNPTFEPGGYVDELVDQGLLDSRCRDIFKIKTPSDVAGRRLRFHKHQTEAIQAAKTGSSYVLTTGTGSGKSLAYIVPIVDHVLRRGSGKGIQAIVVYPMNALANSQEGELEKFLQIGFEHEGPPVRFAKYTGQEKEEEREQILLHPPDILLTNYVMLELILTRPREKNLVAKATGLRFLVFDELHTYRGRQGADVALLARRVREACRADQLQYVGTSATLAGPGTWDQQREEVARVASQLFGTTVPATHVIGETLRRATPNRLGDDGFHQELRGRLTTPTDPSSITYEQFIGDPLSIWIESMIGVSEVGGRLVRQQPRPIHGTWGIGGVLADIAGIDEAEAASQIQAQLMAGYKITNPVTEFRTFAFRLHQFISRGETVYASLEDEETRYITTNQQKFVPERKAEGHLLLPLVFCRECGQEYYSVLLERIDGEGVEGTARPFGERAQTESEEAGYLYVSSEHPWPTDVGAVVALVPDDWVEEHKGAQRVTSYYRKYLPRTIRFGPDGKQHDEGIDSAFVPEPFRFCLRCGVTYGGAQRSDFGKLAGLGSGGRSTATTILAESVIRWLRKSDLAPEARKLLSFTDNRQDASLQAGHFNDFIQIGLLRSALFGAVSDAGDEGLRYDVLALRVFDSLDLDKRLYAVDETVKYAAEEETNRALRNVIGYRLYRDLERGWRVTSPNLEQCGLLRIVYDSLSEVCGDEQVWSGLHPALASATRDVRERVAHVLLDFMRRELCIKVDYLRAEVQEQIQQQSSVRLMLPWAIDENERLETSRSLVPRSQRPNDYRGNVFLSPRGGFGQFIARKKTFPGFDHRFKLEERQEIFHDLLKALRVAGLVEIVKEPKDDLPSFQVPASAFRWKAGDGTEGYHDEVRRPRAPEGGTKTNPFFVNFYGTVAEDAKGLTAREHTAQVPSDLREERETAFRSAKLPILFCSPTMELGVDIAELNAVNMRNVPPTPANYAQRSGRAGRQGQPALVFTYCATGSPHDQYFFRRPDVMVSGQVAPPRIELGNEDLVRAHVHAVWLAETGVSLGASLKDVLDVSGEQPSLELLPSIVDQLQDAYPLERARKRAAEVLASIEPELQASDWYTPGWADQVLNQAVKSFDRACDRWRSLYLAALHQSNIQHKVIQDASRPDSDKKHAKRLRAEAESQLALLTAEDSRLMQSDFYSYRYFASEGFLPGYSFPRLPLSAYIAARQTASGRDEFVSRPRFLAISEFGPRSILYHEGSRYIINRVILPVPEAGDEGAALTRAAKRCDVCGYLHPIVGPAGADVCERCEAPLGAAITSLFRLQNVSTRRRDRITSDEEERQRQGFEIRSALRFVEHGGVPSFRVGEARSSGSTLATLTYGQSATLWRINMGWTRSVKRNKYGFTLDTERGYWAKSEAQEDDVDDPMSKKQAVVIPFVEDHKNALLIEPTPLLDLAQMASLQAALKTAIGVVYQLEDGELASEPLPSDVERRLVLLYESTEGGAGVLRQLLEDPTALARVAAKALDICHFNPATGEDLDSAPGAKERCEAACYDCLMSYRNQRDHGFLDRFTIRETLLALSGATVSASNAPKTREAQLAELMALCDSELEREWLRFVGERAFRLPTQAQRLIAECHTRPDFFYADYLTAVFIDGPHHEYQQEKQLDTAKTAALEDAGYGVVRFGTDAATWLSVIEKHPDVFGAGS
jgi:very-short-patch-repair endonuclease